MEVGELPNQGEDRFDSETEGAISHTISNLAIIYHPSSTLQDGFHMPLKTMFGEVRPVRRGQRSRAIVTDGLGTATFVL